MASSLSATAHEIRPTIADMVIESGQATLTLNANLEALISEVGPEHVDSDDSPSAKRYNELRSLTAPALEAEFTRYASTFLKRIDIATGKSEVSISVQGISVPAVGDERIARNTILVLNAELPEDAESFRFSWDRVYGTLILRVGDDSESSTHNQYLMPGETSQPIPLNANSETDWMTTATSYVKIGVLHIIPKGLDHILFVLGLFLFSTHWRLLLLQISAFTLAHTITLSLGVTGLLQVPSSVVEPLIALSITVVCLDNIITKQLHYWRLTLIVIFGLLHGLGFAGVLGDIGFSKGMFAASLISFNIGVELGQIAVISLCLLLIGWPFGKRAWYRNRVIRPISLLLAFVGLVWFFQRITLL